MQPHIRLYKELPSNKNIIQPESQELTKAEKRADSYFAMKRITEFKDRLIKDSKFSNKRSKEYNNLLKTPLNLETTLKIKMPCGYTLDLILG